MDRRQFLQRTVGSIAGSTVAAMLDAAPPKSRAERFRIGAQTNVFGVPIKEYDHLLQILETMARLGYQGFETNYLSLSSQATRAAECRRAFESRGIRYIGPHTFATLYDRKKAAADIEQIRKIIQYSAEMGALFLVHSGAASSAVEGLTDVPQPGQKINVDAVRIKIEGLNRLGRICREAGMKFTYHNHWQEFMQEPSEMSFLLAETDPKLVWFTFDMGHAQGYPPGPAVFSAQNYRRIVMYQIRDVKTGAPGEKDIQTALGAGQVDLKGVLAPLLNSDWEGWLEAEESNNYPNAVEHPERQLREWRTYVKKLTSV